MRHSQSIVGLFFHSLHITVLHERRASPSVCGFLLLLLLSLNFLSRSLPRSIPPILSFSLQRKHREYNVSYVRVQGEPSMQSSALNRRPLAGEQYKLCVYRFGEENWADCTGWYERLCDSVCFLFMCMRCGYIDRRRTIATTSMNRMNKKNAYNIAVGQNERERDHLKL